MSQPGRLSETGDSTSGFSSYSFVVIYIYVYILWVFLFSRTDYMYCFGSNLFFIMFINYISILMNDILDIVDI